MKRLLPAWSLAAAGLMVSGQGMAVAAPTHDSVTGTQVVQLALQYVGLPYRLTDGNPQKGFSDLGFVRYVYK
ncbi:MAG TPA: hypothetical protein VF221_02580, partial [Chloroflexota bacterium]